MRHGATGFGFSAPAAAPAWLAQPDWFTQFTVLDQDTDPTSTLNFYRRTIHARHALFTGAPLQWLDSGRSDVLAFRRGPAVNVTVMGDSPFTPPDTWGQPTLRTDDRDGSLGGASGAWLDGR